jgi:uncharacterized RDD family membrane protein YckC
MSSVKIATNFNIEIEFVSPPFYRRLVAWFIDVVVQIFYIIIAMRFYSWLSESVRFTKDGSYLLWSIGLILMLPFLTYHLFLETTMNGQSIGKKLTNIKVISENCGTPSLSQYIIRWLIRTSDYTIFILIIMMPYAEIYGPVIYWGMAGAIALLIVDLVLVNSGKQQRLGDILAHTLVINTAQKEKIQDTIFLDVENTYHPSFPEVMQLSDKDLNVLKGIFDTAKRNHDYELAKMASKKIQDHLKINSDLEPIQFIEILLRDYNYYSTR